jgi:hypothetical protein
MKRLLFISALLMASCQGYSTDLPQSILVGIGAEAKWSPDETAIAFRRGDSLYVKSLSPDKPAQGIYYASVVSFEWLDDSTLATYEKQQYLVKGGTTWVERIAKVPLHGFPTEIAKDSLGLSSPRFMHFQRFANGSVGYFDSFASDSKPMQLSQPTATAGKPRDTTSFSLFVGTEPWSWGKVWLYYGNQLTGRQVTLSDNYYQLPQLSPAFDRITCFAMRGDLVVFDTLGKELANLGRADFESWSPDGQYIVFCVIKEAGDPGDIVASDIYIAKWDGSERTEITNTPDLVELDPAFSPSGTKLLYREYPSDKLFVIRVI